MCHETMHMFPTPRHQGSHESRDDTVVLHKQISCAMAVVCRVRIRVRTVYLAATATFCTEQKWF